MSCRRRALFGDNARSIATSQHTSPQAWIIRIDLKNDHFDALAGNCFELRKTNIESGAGFSDLKNLFVPVDHFGKG